VRYSIEVIADHFGIPRTRLKELPKKQQKLSGPKSRRVPLPLHARIERLADQRKAHAAKAELLEAAKWLGNEGSHGNMDAADLMDLLEIYALALHRLYGENDMKRIERRARQINRRRRRG